MTPSSRRFSRSAPATLCVTAACALIAAHSGRAEAQRPAGAPTVLVSRPMASPPDSTPVVREPLARETTPRAIEGLPRRLPTVIPAKQYLVVASTTWSHDWAVVQDSVDTDLFRCAATLGVPRDTMRAFLDERPWRAFDEEVGGSPYVLFQAMPNDVPTAACAQPHLHDPRYLQRGIALVTASLLSMGTNVSDVDVFADDGFRTPTIYGRVPVAATEWFRSPDAPLARPPLVRQVRVYLPMEALDPHGGRFPTVVLRVWDDYLKLIAVPVPGPLSSQLWRELVPWRLEHLRSAVPSGTAHVPGVPTPNDAVLRAAVQRYRRGEVVDAAEQAAAWRALDRARTGGVDTTHSASLRRDRLIADVMVGGVLAAAGDTVAATPFADDALAAAPCLVPSTPATGAYALVVSSRRPSVIRCSGLALSAVARRGLMFPGGGHSVAGDRGLGVAAASAVAITLGGAAVARLAASQRYNDYKDATTVESARRRYAGASAMRDLGLGLVAGSAAIWLADMGYAVVREKHRTARVRAEASFGRERCSGGAAQGCAR